MKLKFDVRGLFT